MVLDRRTLKWLGGVGGGALAYVALKKYTENKAAEERAGKCAKNNYKVAICGGGMSGICMAIKCQEAGIPYVIFEEVEDYGGVWLKNTYPGSACDVESHVYSYSFDPYPDNKKEGPPGWSRVWAPQAEILDYFRSVAKKNKLEANTRFGCRVLGATYHKNMFKGSGKGGWVVRVEDVKTGEVKEEKFLAFVSAIGQLDRPKFPQLPGMEDFAGDAFHTAEWRHDVDLKGKKVIGIGTGPSAIQAFPEIVEKVEHLTIAQRSAVWITSKNDYAYPEWSNWLLYAIPGLFMAKRWSQWLTHEFLYSILIPKARVTNTNQLARKVLTMGMLNDLGPKAKDLSGKILPGYPIACKRLALTSEWMPMVARDNVTVETSKPVRVEKDGIVFSDGESEHKVLSDVIIYATGFHTTDFLHRLDIRDSTGYTLQEKWAGVPHAYNGVSIAGFPNLFCLYGPGTNLGHNSIIFMVECQVDYSLTLLKELIDNETLPEVDIKEELYRKDFEELQADLQETVFAHQDCTSWYKLDTGQVVNNWSSSCISYYFKLKKVNLKDYQPQLSAL